MTDVKADVLVLAGDIGVGTQGVEAAVRWSNQLKIPVIFIAGNHDFYKTSWPSHVNRLRNAAEGSNVHVLENSSVELCGVKFLGCTLWTDFALYGIDTQSSARRIAGYNMNDYQTIKHDDGRKLQPADVEAAHKYSVQWLSDQLYTADGKHVIVTHHAPSIKMLSDRYIKRQDSLSPAFASNLDRMMGLPIDLWISGHSHHNVRCEINGTKLVSNTRGYKYPLGRGKYDDEIYEDDSLPFDPELVIEI